MKNWKNICVNEHQTILEIMQIIDREACQFAMVVDQENRLLGTITDGDLRRAILRSIKLTDPCALAMNTSPTICSENISDSAILQMLKKKKITHIPVLDKNKTIVAVKSLGEFQDFSSIDKENPVILMAGGLGSRLGDLTSDCPKPLLKIGKKPILEIILENFKEQGFKKFYISVNYKSEMIEEYFEDGNKHDIQINYLKEDQKLGTAGALSLLNDEFDVPIIVMNGDLLTKIDFNTLLHYHHSNKHIATMCVRQYEFQVPYGVIQTERDQIIKIDEKPVQQFFVNAGIYILNSKLLSRIPKNTNYDMPTLFNQLLEEKQSIGAFPIHEYWLDIGQKDDFDRAQFDFIKF